MKLFNVIALGALLTVPFGAGCGVSKVCVTTDGGVAGAGGAGGHGAGGAGGVGLGGSSGVGGGGGAGGLGGAAGMAGAGVAGAGVGGGGGLGGAAAIEFTDFVNDLILNKTSSITQPETINDKTFKDSMSPTAFDPLFQ